MRRVAMTYTKSIANNKKCYTRIEKKNCVNKNYAQNQCDEESKTHFFCFW